jgi:hypothetical protein
MFKWQSESLGVPVRLVGACTDADTDTEQRQGKELSGSPLAERGSLGVKQRETNTDIE